jgi:hypothetical protein
LRFSFNTLILGYKSSSDTCLGNKIHVQAVLVFANKKYKKIKLSIVNFTEDGTC